MSQIFFDKWKLARVMEIWQIFSSARASIICHRKFVKETLLEFMGFTVMSMAFSVPNAKTYEKQALVKNVF